MSAVVYRMYDKRNRLLYIGATSNPKERLRHHRYQSPFWAEVVSVVYEDHASRTDALAAEAAAILAEQPVYNVLHRSPICDHDHCGFAAVDGQRCYKHSDRLKFPAGDRRHGAASTYQNYGCRCADCREAWRAYSAKRRAKAAA